MDNRKPPDTNVVQLRRDGDPSDEERQRLVELAERPRRRHAYENSQTAACVCERIAARGVEKAAAAPITD